MDYDDMIRDAAKAICKARYGHLRGFDGREHAYEKEARAAAPILMEYGARLMREAVLPEVVTDWTIDAHGAHCRCTTCELNIAEDSIRALDPATIAKETVT